MWETRVKYWCYQAVGLTTNNNFKEEIKFIRAYLILEFVSSNGFI